MENEIKPENGKPADERPEYNGRNLEEAISLAEHRLKLPREKFNYEIVTEKTRLFGLKCKEIVIRAWAKDGTRTIPPRIFWLGSCPFFPWS